MTLILCRRCMLKSQQAILTNHLLPRVTSSNYTKHNFSMQSTVASVLQTQSGIFKTISESKPVACVQDLLVGVHDVTGLPWWTTIMISTIAFRSVVTLPLTIYQHHILARLELIKQELTALIPELKKETAIAIKMFGWNEQKAKIMFSRSLKSQWTKLIVRENCHPLKSGLVVLFQIPLWVSFSVALRNLVFMLPHNDAAAKVIFLALYGGGFGWIANLTVPDHTLLLPILTGVTNLAIVEIQSMLHANKKKSKLRTFGMNMSRSLSLVMIPLGACVPSCVCLYWATSSSFGLAQNLILLSPKFRRLCRIPLTPSEEKNPFNLLRTQITLRIDRARSAVSMK